MRRAVLCGMASGAVMFGVSAARAHDTWLLPARFEVTPGASIELEMTSGMKFPEPESAVAADRIAASGIRLAGKTLALQPKSPTSAALRLSAAAPRAGVAVLWATSRPRTLSLKPDEVRHYLEEIGAPAAVEARWRQQQRFRESYSKLAKTYVKVGDAPDDRSWQEPVGLGLEIVPLQDPTALNAGSEFPVRVLRDGKPLAGFTLSAVSRGARKPITVRTDGDGRASFMLDRNGPWLLRGTLIEESSAPDTDWQSLFTTLTVSAGPRR